MKRIAINSSDIANIGWEAPRGSYDEDGTLEIEFRATGVYRYFSVPRALYDEMARSVAPRRFFLQKLKGRYAWEKVSAESV